MKHEWGPSRLNHGEAQCKNCFMTNREAMVLGDECHAPMRVPKPANDTKAEEKAE